MDGYSKRTWLNPEGHPSTGSVVAYHGKSPWNDGGSNIVTMLEIADCRHKIRLHRGENDTLEQFVEKMKTLRNVIDEFILQLSIEG